MVKVGFIVEGSTESIIINSTAFIAFLQHHGYELVKPVIDAEGGGNLLPKYVDSFVDNLKAAGADRICILTDLEDEASTDVVRTRIAHGGVDISFIAIKAIEAWFLADSEAMKAWLNVDTFYEEYPEITDNKPWDRLRQIAQQLDKRGTGSSKTIFANKMVTRYGFDVSRAASHSQYASARELNDWFENNNNI